MDSKGKVAIVGSGLIGSCWATLFASAGYRVCLFDVNEGALAAAQKNVEEKLKTLEEQGLRRGSISASEAAKLICSTTSLKDALENAVFAQESTLETVEFKQKIFSEMDNLAPATCILSSSTSTIPPSKFTEGLTNRGRCLVAHPVNPPLYLRLVEVIPAPWTRPESVQSAMNILKDIGQEPIRLNKEVVGFAVNRLQFALIAEAWRLVADGVLSVEDVDKVMSAGLGPRYAFYGPFETIHLNANGVADYSTRYSPGMRNVMADFGPNPSFNEPEVVAKLERVLNEAYPLDQMADHQRERVSRLAELEKLKLKK